MKRFVFFILVVFLAGLAGCEQSGQMDKSRFSGTLEMTEHSLGFNASGRMATIAVDEGDAVKAGQVLATLDRYAQSQKDHDRLAQLQSVGGASPQDVEHAALARDDMMAVSPIDGVVLLKVREAGESVNAGAPIVVLGDRSDMWVKIYVPEGMINRVAMNAPVRINFDGLKKDFLGHVSFIATQAEFTPRNVQTPEERVTQTFAVKVKLDETQEYLRPGVAADVYLDVREK